MNIISDFFGDTFIYSFGWTLVHSIWHGIIISITTLLLLAFLKNQSSRFRYQMLVVSMFSIVILSIWTFSSFFNYYDSLFSSNETTLGLAENISIQSNFGIILLDILPQNVVESLNYYTIHLPLIFTVWLISILFLSIKYLGGYIYSQRLRSSRTSVVSGFWIDKVEYFSTLLGVKQKISLLESSLIKVPMVIGFLKPVILLPIGLLTGIPNEQIEAILIHELAHIRRKDYLIKLLQTIVEIIFFFNPFVWWISSLINKERENCCDDLAISITKDNISFVKALAGLCELELKNTGLALTFGKSNNQIIKRMERIMKRNENKNNFSNFTIALLILLTSLVAFGAVSLKSSEKSVTNDSVENTNNEIELKASTNFLDPPPPPPQEDDKKKQLAKLKKSMKKVKAAYSEENDPEKKKKYKEKLMTLEKKAKAISKEMWKNEKSAKEKVVKKNPKLIIEKLEGELAKTKDKEKRAKIKKKIQYFKQEMSKTPPPPPPPKS